MHIEDHGPARKSARLAARIAPSASWSGLFAGLVAGDEEAVDVLDHRPLQHVEGVVDRSGRPHGALGDGSAADVASVEGRLGCLALLERDHRVDGERQGVLVLAVLGAQLAGHIVLADLGLVLGLR